jgi:hypothetical protein
MNYIIVGNILIIKVGICERLMGRGAKNEI